MDLKFYFHAPQVLFGWTSILFGWTSIFICMDLKFYLDGPQVLFSTTILNNIWMDSSVKLRFPSRHLTLELLKVRVGFNALFA